MMENSTQGFVSGFALIQIELLFAQTSRWPPLRISIINVIEAEC